MPEFEFRKDLYDAIKEKGQNVNQFVNRAIEDALKVKPMHAQNVRMESCFTDDHCVSNL